MAKWVNLIVIETFHFVISREARRMLEKYMRRHIISLLPSISYKGDSTAEGVLVHPFEQDLIVSIGRNGVKFVAKSARTRINDNWVRTDFLPSFYLRLHLCIWFKIFSVDKFGFEFHKLFLKKNHCKKKKCVHPQMLMSKCKRHRCRAARQLKK